MKVFKESFKIEPEVVEQLKAIEVEPEIVEEIRKELLKDLKNYFNMPEDKIVNVNNLYESRAEIVNNYIDSLVTLWDIVEFAVVSFNNSKLGNRIAVFNVAGYFNCHGLINGWCSCTKTCYAGRLEFRQFKKTIRNTIFFLYCKYSIKAEIYSLFEIGIKRATNKGLLEVNTVLYEVQAIRFNEAGEIRDLIDLSLLNRVVRVFREELGRAIKAYTYTTNPAINTFSSSAIVINKSLGFNLKALDTEVNNIKNCRKYNINEPEEIRKVSNSFTVIIKEPEEIKDIYNKYHAYKSISLCSGSCRTCRKCSKYNNVVVFLLHGNKSKEQLQQEIGKAASILNEIKGSD